MNTVGIRELGRNASQVVDDVERTKKPALVTRHGRPAVALVPIDPDELENWILANAPEFVKGMRSAEEELRAGKTKSLDEFMESSKPTRTGKRASGARRSRR